MVDDAGHALPHEQPDLLRALVAEWLCARRALRLNAAPRFERRIVLGMSPLSWCCPRKGGSAYARGMSTRSRALRGAAVAALSVGAIGAAGAGLACRYRRELGAAQARLAAVDRKVVTAGFGEVEYVERGTGEPVLVSHGIFQSSESVLLFGELFPGRRVIAPSRFGYLGSNLPPKATPAGPGRRLRRAA